jgi:hypothetical protein
MVVVIPFIKRLHTQRIVEARILSYSIVLLVITLTTTSTPSTTIESFVKFGHHTDAATATATVTGMDPSGKGEEIDTLYQHNEKCKNSRKIATKNLQYKTRVY